MDARRPRRLVGALGALAAALAALGGGAATPAAGHSACAPRRPSPAYVRRVERALAAGRDVFGEALLAAPEGPSLAAARRDLAPILYAGHVPGRRAVPLTDSGVYYLAFGEPGTGVVRLHLADGSEILAGSVFGPRLRVGVGRDGREPYGSCLARLATPSLAGGYLPVLETRYLDADGVRYAQESFSAGSTSYLRLAVDARAAGAVVRLAASRGRPLVRVVPAGARATLLVGWRPPAGPVPVGPAAYAQARRGVVAFWRRTLAAGADVEVPDPVVEDAARATLVQNLTMGWRYSVGNPYAEFEYPESLDAAAVMGEYGFPATEASALEAALRRQPALYPNWEMGAKLLTTALDARLFGDGGVVARALPVLAGYLGVLARELGRSRLGLLRPERWTSDLPETGYALDGQAVVWQALRAIAPVFARSGRPQLAREALALAARLGAGLRTAVRRSERWLPDGSLYVPIELDRPEQPPAEVLRTRDGSYWNYELPYALASGLFPPGGRQATGVLRFYERHGSLLLGQIRVNAYALYASPRFPTSGTDDVYDLNLARFLADNHQAGRLDVTLYGQLAAGMTPGTFVAGEAASVAPIDGAYDRSTYLPPNSTANAAFLETLRLTLVHELDGADGEPDGLELADATPRRWLEPGRTIAVRDLPTSFGPIAYAIRVSADRVDVTLAVPRSPALRILRLALRLPGRRPLRAVTLDGEPYRRFDPGRETIDLSGRAGRLVLVARYAR